MPGVDHYLIARVGKTGGVEDHITAQAAFNQSPEAFAELVAQMLDVLRKERRPEARQLELFTELTMNNGGR